MDSRDSSPCSRDGNPSFEDPPPSFKVKLMCSYGGKIQPRSHDNNLTYFGGDTKILAVDRTIKFSALIMKLSSLTNATTNTFFFKYQLPGEDLDALISVTNDEDLHHMMVEYDRLCRISSKPARLRLFLFPLNNNNNSNTPLQTINFGLTESKPERQWFVDALNSVQVPLPEGSSPPPTAHPVNPDFLFGLDNSYPAAKPVDFATVPDVAAKDSECGSQDRETVKEPEPEIQELQRLQLGNNEQRKLDEENGRFYGVDSFPRKNSEEVTPLVARAHAHAQVHPGVVPGTMSFLPERNNSNNPGIGYSMGFSATGNEPVGQPVYLIQTPSGIYQAVRHVTGPVGQPVYLVQTPGSVSHKGGYNGSEVGVASEHGYSQVAYLNDRSGLQRQAAAGHGGDGWN